MVEKAIESALNQTYTNIEVLVVDNHSTDNTDKVVASFQDQRLRYVKNSRNLGLFGNFNRCIELARGEFIHILHSDDTITHDFTETCIRFFIQHPDVALTFTSLTIITTKEKRSVSFSDKDIIIHNPEGFQRLLQERSFIPCPSVMVRKEVYSEVGNYPLEYPYSSDYWMWLQISRKYSIAFIKNVSVNYHQGEHSESYRFLFQSPAGYLDILRIYIRLISEHGEMRSDFSDNLNVALHRYIGDCIFAGFTRSEKMVTFSPMVIGSLALDAWALVYPRTIGSWLQHWMFLPVLLGAWCLMGVPGVRNLIKMCIFKESSIY
jgi:hypothetical protein